MVFLFFCSKVQGILAPPPGIESFTPCIGRWSLNHWTMKEAPLIDCFYYVIFSWFSSYFSVSNFLVSSTESSASVFLLKKTSPQGSPKCCHLVFVLHVIPGKFQPRLCFSYVPVGESQICNFGLLRSLS